MASLLVRRMATTAITEALRHPDGSVTSRVLINHHLLLTQLSRELAARGL